MTTAENNRGLELSIILPTYNERENVKIFVPQLEKVFSGIRHEIIVVDDSSPDGTAAEVERLEQVFGNVRLLSRPGKLGVGSAVRHGYDQAAGEIILSSDTDLAFKPEDLLKLYRAAAGGCDLAVGSRHSYASGRDIPTLTGKARYFVSRLGNRFLRLVFGIPLDDFSMNCRAIRRDLWQKLNTQASNNFFFYEMVFLARARGAGIIGVPVAFTERRLGKSKINLAIEIPRVVWQLVRFLLRRR